MKPLGSLVLQGKLLNEGKKKETNKQCVKPSAWNTKGPVIKLCVLKVTGDSQYINQGVITSNVNSLFVGW